MRIRRLFQRQKAGKSSTMIQAGRDVVVAPLSRDDVASIARQVMESEIAKLSESARLCASDRLDWFIERLLDVLEARQVREFDPFANPDTQYVLHQAQTAFARSGDKDLAEILVELVSERLAGSPDDLAHVVLGEAVEVVPKLVTSHFAILSVVFVLRYTVYNRMHSRDAFRDYMERLVCPFIPSLKGGAGFYQHLEYAGCGSIQLGTVELCSIFIKNYPWVFSRPIEEEVLLTAVPEGFGIPQFFQRRADAEGLFELSPNWRYKDIKSYCEGLEVPKKDKQAIEDLWRQRLLEPNEIRPCVVELIPQADQLFDLWENSPLQSLNLTSVGIAIATAHINARVGEEFKLARFLQTS